MSVDFNALDEQLSGAVDDAFGESIIFDPAVKTDNWSNAREVNGRYQQTVIGVLIEGQADIQFLDGDRRISQFNGRSIVCDAWVTFDRSAFAANNQPRKGDKITSTVPTTRIFEIVDVLNDANARFACPLTRLPT